MSDIFDFETGIENYAVMGDPVSHSKSPAIHHAFAEQTRQHIQYEATQVDPGGFVQAVEHFFASGGKGLNVTVPFKTEAFTIADELSERAALAGAVNTLLMRNNNIIGDNTDGAGLTSDLCKNLDVNLADKRILILGAGGASRGVLLPLLNQHPACLAIANRTPDKAYDLAKLFSQHGHIEGLAFTSLKENIPTEKQFDVVINATSASLKGDVPPISSAVFADNAWCYDMMYGAKPTVFMQWAAEQGVANISDGLGMLVEQAAESFYLWRGIRPETQPVIQKIRSDMK